MNSTYLVKLFILLYKRRKSQAARQTGCKGRSGTLCEKYVFSLVVIDAENK
jgi:hypothetical protein